MSFMEIFCPGGSSSQTGTAANERYIQTEIINCGGIPDAETQLNSGNTGPFVIPIWNSNQGEIEASNYVWNLIEEDKIKILDIWPKKIEFWLIAKTGQQPKSGTIGSVTVARSQCSNFLKDHGFKDYPLTTDAFDGYKNGDQLDGVLLAPGQGNENGYKIVSKQIANNNNFTSFVTLTTSNSAYTNCKPNKSWLTGVTIGNLSSAALDDEQISFFRQMFLNAMNLNEIPKLIFVFKRTDKVGLLFEGENYTAGDFLNAEQLEAGDIIVHENAGELKRAYTEELHSLLSQEFTTLIEDDFILHRGNKTVLFSCPVLGMYTHGFEENTVESVVRFYINMVFEFIDNGGFCSVEQHMFFEKYEATWKKNHSDFIIFKVIE